MRIKRHGRHRRLGILAMAMGIVGLAASALLGAGAADAMPSTAAAVATVSSGCPLGTATNPWTGHTYFVQDISITQTTSGGQNVANREGCGVVWVVGSSTGDYVFKAAIYDMWDANGVGPYEANDLGSWELWFKTPGSSDWHQYVYDRNATGVVNESCAGSQIDPCALGYGNTIGANPNQFVRAINGPPEQFVFQFRSYSQYRQIGGSTTWLWSPAKLIGTPFVYTA